MNNRKNWWTSVALIYVLVGSGCLGEGMSEATEKFLRQPMDEQRRAILRYPPKQQVDLYIWAMMAEHPPDLALVDIVASNGAKIVPFLKQRLVEEHGEIEKMHLIDVFGRMQEIEYYLVASDGKLMSLLEQQIDLMEDPLWKGMSSDVLDGIKSSRAR